MFSLSLSLSLRLSCSAQNRPSKRADGEAASLQGEAASLQRECTCSRRAGRILDPSSPLFSSHDDRRRRGIQTRPLAWFLTLWPVGCPPASRLSGCLHGHTALGRLARDPCVPGKHAVQLSGCPGCPGCPAALAARLPGCPGCPGCPAALAARLPWLPGCPGCPAALAPWLPRTLTHRLPGSLCLPLSACPCLPAVGATDLLSKAPG